jgi:hypothetical protein
MVKNKIIIIRRRRRRRKKERKSSELKIFLSKLKIKLQNQANHNLVN